PTFVISWIFVVVERKWPGLVPGVDADVRNVVTGFCVFGVWILKEVRDLTLASRAAKRSKSDFKFNSKEIWWNVFTAWIFFAMGSIVAVLSFIDEGWALTAIPPCLIVTALVSYWWLSRKITFQQAALPYLYRLANFPNNIPDEYALNRMEVRDLNGLPT